MYLRFKGVHKMKLSKSMIQKIWNVRNEIDNWVVGKQYVYKVCKWCEPSKRMLVAIYQYGKLVDTLVFLKLVEVKIND